MGEPMTLPVTVLGVDPGSNGAACVLRRDRAGLALVAWAKLERPERIAQQVQGMCLAVGGVDVAYLESALSIPRDKSKLASIAVYHQNVGAMRAAVGALGVRVVMVEPAVWQRAVGARHLWGPQTTEGQRKRAIHAMAVSGVVGAETLPIYAGDALMMAVYGERCEAVA